MLMLSEWLWWISAAAAPHWSCRYAKTTTFFGVGTTPFALANRLGFEIGSTRDRPPRRAARNALLRDR
jgi:hypothetical protein